MKLYIAVLDQFPDYMTPTLVAHAMLGAHLEFQDKPEYVKWLKESFKKCVVRVNQREFDNICKLDNVYLAHENKTLGGNKACAVVCPRETTPNVLRYAKLWAPAETPTREDALRHPAVQLIMGAKARMNIELGILEDILDFKHEFSPTDMEYWSTIHDKADKLVNDIAIARTQRYLRTKMSEEDVGRWWETPNAELDNRKPLDCDLIEVYNYIKSTQES